MLNSRRVWRDDRIVVFKIDNYNTTQAHPTVDAIEEALAVIVGRQGDNQEAEIRLAGGTVWKATCSPNKVFQFVLETGNLNGISTVTWQPIGGISHGFDIIPTSASNDSPAQEQQYKFSVVHSGRRRNPILASLTRTRLEIAEHYVSRDLSVTDPTSTVKTVDEYGDLCMSKEMDDKLKTLIQVTAIWIALSRGWYVGFDIN